jgi:hypothetical protein
MVVELRKPVPFTVIVSDVAPAGTVAGLIELTVGAVGDVFVPPVFEEEPQPVSKMVAKRPEIAVNPSSFLMIYSAYTLNLTEVLNYLYFPKELSKTTQGMFTESCPDHEDKKKAPAREPFLVLKLDL